MSEYVFPFSSVTDTGFSEIFTDEVLPLHLFRSLEALRVSSDFSGNDRFTDEIDRDIVSSNQTECSYLDLNSYNELIYSDNFSLIFLNVNSLPKHHDSIISQFLSNSSMPDIIGFCETKLDDSIENLYTFPGYVGVFSSKSTRSGGLALFLKSGIQFEKIEQCSFMHESIESLCVKVSVNNCFLTLCLVYRRPGTRFDDFLANYTELMRNLKDVKCMLFGDLNLDLLKYESCTNTQTFVNFNFENYFFPMFNRPTRISSHSATVIDHLWCNFIENSHFDNKIILTDFSDHFALFTRIVDNSEHDSPAGKFYYRDWSKVENEDFQVSIESKVWEFQDELGSSNVDSALDKLVHIISSTIDEFCPRILVSQRKKYNPWITTEIKELIKEKNRLFSKYCRKPISFGNQYRNCRNRLNNLIKHSKKHYYATLLNSLKSNTKKTWDTINTLLNRNSKSRLTRMKTRENLFTSSPVEIANIMNDHFTNAPQNIADSLAPTPDLNYRDYLTGNYSSSLFIHRLTPDKVYKIILGLKNSSSGGYLDVPTRVIKSIASIISESLSIILNECICNGIFPDKLKIAQVTPVFKSGDTTDPNNYRPISVLTVFSKILEKHIYHELLSYLNSCNILIDEQCGFREGISTSIAIGKFLSGIYEGINDGKFSIGVFLDLKKAFDCVDHDILLGKLYHYGVRGMEFELIKNFLSNRTQYVKISEQKSCTTSINIGTPQGSILSPLLFLVFINDLVNCSSLISFNLFADDTCISLSDSNLNNLYNNLNRELVKVGNWISANHLSLNISKTVYLLFSGKKKIPHLPILYLHNEPIQQKHSTKFLGLILDDVLSWKTHAQHVISKVSRLAGIFNKIRNFLPSHALKTIYYALVQPHLQYGIIFWSGVNKTNLNKIFRIQKKIVRFITNSDHLAHTTPLFKNLSILKLDDIRKLEMAKFIFNDIEGPNFFHFINQSSLHSYHTRNQLSLRLPQPRSNILLRSVFYEGIKIFNSLDQSLRSCNTTTTFKFKFKFSLISEYDL